MDREPSGSLFSAKEKHAMCRAIILLAALFAVASARDAAAKDRIAHGRAIAQANCSRCHAIGVTGKSPNAAAPPFRTLTRKYPLQNLEEALAEGIVVGHEGSDMPRFQFAPTQIAALLAYLGSIQRK
jgi:mono/diheme cytochrome c family protein